MSVNNTAEIIKGLRRLDWSEMVIEPNGTVAAVIVDGAAVKVEKIDGKNSYEDYDDLFVVVQVGTQMFRKTGTYDSHSGADMDGAITEVVASPKTVTVYIDR